MVDQRFAGESNNNNEGSPSPSDAVTASRKTAVDEQAELAQVNALYSLLENRYSVKVTRGTSSAKTLALMCATHSGGLGTTITDRWAILHITRIWSANWTRHHGDRGLDG